MRELILRHAAPCAVCVFELEAPVRVLLVADGDGERRRLLSWLTDSELETVNDAAGDAQRARVWSRTLAAEPGGVCDRLLDLLLASRREDGG